MGIAASGSGSGSGGTGAAADAAGGVYVPQLGMKVPKRKAAAIEASTAPRTRTAHPRPRRRGPFGTPHMSILPARLLSNPQGFFSTSLLYPLVNEWMVADHRRFTAVDAGADPVDRSKGVFGIFRQNYVQVSQKPEVLRVAGAGALKITKAPLGPKVVTWAQKRGNLEFTSRNGVTGTLHLKDDTVTLDTP